jgi:hypothetical protein
MKALDTLPGESNTSIISSIINLACRTDLRGVPFRHERQTYRMRESRPF